KQHHIGGKLLAVHTGRGRKTRGCNLQRQSCGFVAGLDIPHTFTAISNSGGNLNI
ncbi:hypothetical protein BCGKFG_BCGKFG_06090, partial [Dysosmobacter welbionis]